MSANFEEIEMTAEGKFRLYKSDLDKKLVKRVRTQSIILGSATVIAVLGIVYGLINDIEASAHKDIAVMNAQIANQANAEASKCEELKNELQRENADLKTQLDKCKSGK